MRFGYAKELVTPCITTNLGGYTSRANKPFLGIHDDLYIKTLLLMDGQNSLVLIAVDLLFHDYYLTQKIASYIDDKYNIRQKWVYLAYTHTHGGVATEGYDPGQEVEKYEDFLYERLTNCIDRAFLNIIEGRIFFGKVEGDWNINRRLFFDGKWSLRPNPSGLRDMTLNAMRICDMQGNIRVILLNYACHPVSFQDTLYITSDYPGRLCQIMENEFYGCMSMFIQGAGGNARPLITANGFVFKACTYDEVDKMALSMADSVKKLIYRNKMREVQLDLASKVFSIKLDLEPYLKDTFVDMCENYPMGYRKEQAEKARKEYESIPDAINLNAGVIRLGKGLYIAVMGGEPCYEVKQNIEKLFGNRDLMFFGYIDAVSYIPDDKILSEGGYEGEGYVIEYCLKGKFKTGIDVRIEDAYKKALDGLII